MVALQKRRDYLHSRILALEKLGHRPVLSAATAAADEARATALLDGADWAVASKASPVEELSEIYRERSAVDRALERGVKNQLLARARRVDEMVVERAGEWRDLVRQRVQLALSLRRVDRACNAFNAELWSPFGAAPSLPANMPPAAFFGGDRSVAVGELHLLIERALKAGIVTPKEIEQWSQL